MAMKSDIVTFKHVKSIKVTSGFNLRKMKKICQVALSYKKSKNKYQKADISSIDTPPGVPGVSKDVPVPLNMPFEVWCAKIAPKLKNIQKSLRK
jgi:hypothetical protein